MRIVAAIETSIREIFAQKFRSLLSMLGIVLGVSSLVATLGLTAGIERGTRQVLQQIGGLERVAINHVDLSSGDIDFWSLSPGRTWLDAVAIRRSAPLISHISPELRQWVPVATGDGERGIPVAGVEPDFFTINSHSLEAGRLIAPLDLETASRVVVLGATIAETLFPGKKPADILGREVTIRQIPYQVIGVLTFYQRDPAAQGARGRRQQRSASRWDFFRMKNESVIIPFTTMFYDFKSGAFPQHTPSSVPLEVLALRIADLDFFQEAIEQARATLRETHRGVEDFDFDTRQDYFSQVEEGLRATRISGGLIAGISLLVGGIGIMNIMLASISQRVREIGVRRAIGAKASDIFGQILVESTLIALIGAAFGVLAGAFLMQVLVWIAPEQNMPVMTLGSVVLSVLFAAVAGVFSGLYPAFKAAALDPITALRYE